MREVEKEARAEGRAAEEELGTFRVFFRLSREILTARKAKGLTQRQLVLRSGINQSEISDIERGQANPTFHPLQAIAKGLGQRVTLVRSTRHVARRSTRSAARCRHRH